MTNPHEFRSLTLHSSGAHLTSADSPSGEILYLSSASKFGGGNAIRGGVPLIGPWFGDLLDANPKHGWARISEWEVDTDDAGERLTAHLSNDDLALVFHAKPLDDGFDVSFRLTNESDRVRTVQLAFHPYFRVQDVAEIRIDGFDGLDLLNRLTDETTIQDGPVQIDGEFDRIALGTSVAVITDSDRTITVTGRGHDSTVIWNPGEDAAAGMSDVGAGEWKDFVCVEPALLGSEQRGVNVSPGESVEIGMTVMVSSTP